MEATTTWTAAGVLLSARLHASSCRLLPNQAQQPTHATIRVLTITPTLTAAQGRRAVSTCKRLTVAQQYVHIQSNTGMQQRSFELRQHQSFKMGWPLGCSDYK
jgi:hypothetical protein